MGMAVLQRPGLIVGPGLIIASILIVVLASGCAASSDQPRPQTAMVGKRELLRRMEGEMNDLVRAAVPRCAVIRQATLDQLNQLPTPSRLQVVDEVLARYGQSDEEQFIAKIDAIVNDGVKRLDEIAQKLEQQVQKKAYKVAGNDLPTETEFSTGYVEIDDIARTTIDQARRIADREGLRDLGYFRRGEVVRFTRTQRVDAPNVGRLSLFLSPPIPNKIVPGQESVGVVAAVQRKGIAPEVPLRFLQAVRHQILRAGVPVRDLGWRLDPNSPNHDGVVPIDEHITDANYLVSRVAYPALRSDNPEFAAFRDFTFLASFELGVQRTDTGELVAGCAYELRWHVTFNGQVILLEGHNARPRIDHFAVLDHLLKGKPAPVDEPAKQAVPDARETEPSASGKSESGYGESQPSDSAGAVTLAVKPSGSELPKPAAQPAAHEGEAKSEDTSAQPADADAKPLDDAPASDAKSEPPSSGGGEAKPDASEQHVDAQAATKSEVGEKLEMEVPPSAAKDENALAMTWTISPALAKELHERGQALLDRYTDALYTPSVKVTRLVLVMPKTDKAAADAKPPMPPDDAKLFQDLGVKLGDVLVSINKVPIASKSFLLTALSELAKAEQLEIVLLRDDQERTLRYTMPKE